jgi:GT2 family glycosyltransferase
VDSAGPTAPPVVAVVVARDPGPWFDEVLDSLAEQDYPSLRVLVLDTGTAPDLPDRVTLRIPGAFIRRAVAHPTYGGAANEALKLVEGAGFFCFLHDDVALDPNAIRLMVEETYRSNAGIVGPKIVQWDDPGRLLSAGVGADKFGEPAPSVEPGELDQEQHDAVRDTFSLSTACVVVRTDLFRAVGGFDSEVAGRGDELDLCWRAHAGGARVMVVPAARARRRSADEPLDDRTRERMRLRTVLASYSGWHLVRVLPQYAVVTIIEALASLLTGHARRGGALLAAWPGALGEMRSIRRKRHDMKRYRQVSDNEVRRLQMRGSARLSAFFRGHSRRTSGAGSSIGNVTRELIDMFRTGRHRATYAAWLAIVVIFLFGSRVLITDRIPALGEFLQFPGHATALIGDYFSGWWAHGLGSAIPVPSGVAMLGLGGLGFLGSMSFFRTVTILAPVLLGFVGVWRLVRPLGPQRARLTGLIVYAAVALPYNAIAVGRWSGLIVYGAMPWVAGSLARLSGLAPYAPTGEPAANARPVRSAPARIVALGLLVAVTAAFVPVFAIEVVLVALALALGSLLVGGIDGALRALGAAVGAAVVAVVLNLPWASHALLHLSGTLGSAPLASADDSGLDALLRFATATHDGGIVAYLLLVPAVVALLLGRGWRLAWAGRASVLAVTFFAIAWTADRGWGPTAGIPVEVWLVPAAVGLAWAGACGAVAVDDDVRGTRLSWRQPLGVLAVLAVAIGVLPSIGAAGDGAWDLGRTDNADALAFLPSAQVPGDYRILWVGDPRALPQPGWKLADGVAYGLSENGAPTVRDRWRGEPTRSEQLVADAFQLAATGETSRLGRMLGPMSVRYIIVPLRAGPQTSGAQAYPPPSALVNTLAGQLDLRQKDIDDALVVYENEAWIPERARLSDSAAAASDQAGFESLVRTDVSGATAVLPDEDGANRWRGDVPAGVTYLAAPANSRWHLEVDGRSVDRRPAFGWANAFDVTTAGAATLSYDTPFTRYVLVALQAVLWLAAIAIAVSLRRRSRRRPQGWRASRERHPSAHVPVAVGAQHPELEVIDLTDDHYAQSTET